MLMSETALATAQATFADIGSLGAGFYFIPPTLGRGKELGMPNGMVWYVCGRGSVLGDCNAELVVSAFGYFEPNMIRKMWAAGTAVMPASKIVDEYAECARAWGRATFGGVKSAGKFADLAEKIIAAGNSAGSALFAGWKAVPLGAADDPAGRAGMAFNVLREHRGSLHLQAVIAAGLTPAEAHFTKGGDARWKIFGWPEDATPAPKKAVWNKAERTTDLLTAQAYEVLTAKEADAFTKAVAQLAKAAAKKK